VFLLVVLFFPAALPAAGILEPDPGFAAWRQIPLLQTMPTSPAGSLLMPAAVRDGETGRAGRFSGRYRAWYIRFLVRHNQ
jgi:hypothetical protein